MNSGKVATIYDIAREAGVSPATVSRVLTKSANVSKAKKEKIEELIVKYDFKPNALARGLTDTKTNIIGIITADIRNPFYASIFVSCEKAADKRGYTLFLSNSFGKKELESKHLEKMLEQRVDAIIQVGGRVDELITDTEYVEQVNRIANRVPVVITGKLDGADCYQVNIDEGHSMEILVEYLIGLGHREIALLGGRGSVKSTVDKRLRYKQLLNRYAIPYQKEYVIEGNYDDESGYQCMNELFETGKIPSAIIAINDFTAMGVVRSIQEHGLSIPYDISVASFDNTVMAECCNPKLTSVSYNYKHVGEKLIDVVIDAIEGKDAVRSQLVKAELVVRNSCEKVKSNS